MAMHFCLRFPDPTARSTQCHGSCRGSTSKTASRYKMTWFVPHSGGACEREARCWVTELSQPSHSAGITYNLQGTLGITKEHSCRNMLGSLTWTTPSSATQLVKSRLEQPLTLGAQSIERRASCCNASAFTNGGGLANRQALSMEICSVVATQNYQITSNPTLTRSTE